MRARSCDRRELAYYELTHGRHELAHGRRELAYYELILCFLLTLNSCLVFFADMNSLNWASPTGRKSRGGRGVGTSAAGEAVGPKQGHEDCPPSPMIGVSSGSSNQRLEQVPPYPACVSPTGKSITSSSKLSDSMARYLEAFKTSLGDISPKEWNTLEDLTDEDSMGAATRAAMMVRHSLA